MKKQFNYTRPVIMYVGYTASLLIFVGIVGLLLPEGKLTIKLFLIASSFLLSFILMEKLIFQKYKVNLTEDEIEIEKLSGKKSVKYDSIHSLKMETFSNSLIIKSGHKGNTNTVIPGLRIAKRDLKLIKKMLSERIEAGEEV